MFIQWSANKAMEGGRRHNFSPAMMQSLAAMCEAILPPLPPPVEDQPPSKFLVDFYSAYGSTNPIPDEIAEKMERRAPPSGLLAVKVVFWLLSFRLGTLLLCGHLCLGGKFSFVRKFSEMSIEEREAVLQRWSGERLLVPLRVVFVFVKIFTFFIFFSRTDANSENKAWKAIGYDTEKIDLPENVAGRPLDKGVVDMAKETDASLPRALNDKSLAVTNVAGVHRIDCDVVVVGSGAGGGVAAAVLSAAGHQVVVVEKGLYFAPADYSGLEGQAFEEMYESGGILSTDDGRLLIFAGATEKKKKKKRCVGVVATSSSGKISKELHIRARIIVSACGSLLTPPLMVASGLKNPNIGKNLHLHPVIIAWGYFPETISDLTGKKADDGILTSVHKIKEGTVIEATSMGSATFCAVFPWTSGKQMKDDLTRYSRTAQLFALTRDRGSGEVRKEGRISYKFDKSDTEELRYGLKRALRILVAAGAVEVGTHRSDGQRLACKGLKEEELEAFLDEVHADGGPMCGAEYWTIYGSAHQMGSCRMGATANEGGVDSKGESWEAEGLYVCDGSVLPSALGVNPMITIQSVSYCIANNIAEAMREEPIPVPIKSNPAV